MKVLVGCEVSARVRDAFRARGHTAYSCDLLPTEGSGMWHIRGDVLGPLRNDWWDLAIFFPPCTYLCSSGLHWNKRRPERAQLTEDALEFVAMLLNADVHRIALENPIGCISSRIRRPDQIIQPWQFGHPESKQTALWLKNLPLLTPTNILTASRVQKNGKPRWDNMTPTGQSNLGPSAERAAERGRTYQGIADAMAEQWGAAA